MRRPTSATARQQPGPCATHVLHGGPQCVAPVVPARCPQRVAAVLVRDDRKQGSCGNFLPYDQPCPSSSGRTWDHVTDPGTARLLRVAALLAALVLLPMTCPATSTAETTATSDVFSRYSDEAMRPIPEKLRAADEDAAPRKTLGKLLQGSQKRQVQQCAKECVGSCSSGRSGQTVINGEKVNFDPGYHSRQYCLRTCTDVCADQAEASERSGR